MTWMDGQFFSAYLLKLFVSKQHSERKLFGVDFPPDGIELVGKILGRASACQPAGHSPPDIIVIQHIWRPAIFFLTFYGKMRFSAGIFYCHMKLKLYAILLFAIFSLCFVNKAEAQLVITSNDTSICEGVQFNIHADIQNGRTPNYINFTQNNVFSSVINLGFSFTFYGTAYTQCVISPNGQISFNTANAGQPADNVVDEAVPGELSTLNSIMMPYIGLDILAGGTIDYATIGVAPNRRFVVTFCSVPMFTCNNLNVSFQAVLQESTNLIDLHLIDNPGPACGSWNFGRSIQGVQDPTGSFATTVPNRNWPLAWFGNNDSHRFTPAGVNNYNVTTIPHTHIPDATATIRWYAGGFQVGTGPDFLYTYISPQTLVARVSNCPDTSADTINVSIDQVYNITSADSTNPSQCEAADGTITLFGFLPGESYEVHYTDPAGNPVTINSITADGGGGLLITGLVEGDYTWFYVISQAGCRSNFDTSIELFDDAIVIGGAQAVLPTGCNGTDGSIVLTGLVPGVTYTIDYVFNSNPFTIVLTANANGDVTIPNLSAGTYTNITASTIDCNSNTIASVTILDPLPVIASAAPTMPTLCRGTDGFITLTGLLPDSNYVAKYELEGTVYTVAVVADANGDVIIPNLGAGLYEHITVTLLTCESAEVGPVTLINPAITADFTWVLLPGCTEDTIVFTDNSSGSAVPFQYLWSFGDTTTDTVQNPVHIYQEQGTYSVSLLITDSVCIDSTTIDVQINHPLVANFTVDEDTICQGTPINFTDASTATPPVSYYWDFANGEINDFGVPTATSVYTRPGNYNAMLVVTDFIGCTDTAYQYIRVDSLTEILISFADSAICAGEKAYITASYEDTGSTGVTWDFADGIAVQTNGHEISHSYEYPGLYAIHVIATGRVCPDVDSMKLLVVEPQPLINIGPDTSMCPTAGTLVIHDLINGGNSAARWTWMQGDERRDEATFNLMVEEPGTYSSTVTIGQCSASDTVLITKDCYIDVPNVFTPDGDNNNDHFLPRQLLSKSVSKFKMQIFNRWGQEVFLTNEIGGRGWDGNFNGEPQPQGVYIYLIDVTFSNNVREQKQGNVTLLR
jgi:gliding motility-associated-like protein